MTSPTDTSTEGPAMQGVLPKDIIELTPNVYTEPYWLATAEHRLILPKCTTCGTYRFPPGPFCWNCRAQEVEWVEHDGTGTIYSFTIVRHPVIPEVAEALPAHDPGERPVNSPGSRLGIRLGGPILAA